MLEEFKKFAMRGNVVDLAVGVIIGAAFGAIVSSLVADLIMKIKRETGIGRKLCQPSCVCDRADRGREMGRGRIRCISRRRLFGEDACLRCHDAFDRRAACGH